MTKKNGTTTELEVNTIVIDKLVEHKKNSKLDFAWVYNMLGWNNGQKRKKDY